MLPSPATPELFIQIRPLCISTICLTMESPSPVPAECLAKVLFYSADDEFLMGLTFARPFMVGLLAAVELRLEAALGHAPVRLFGWRDGLVVPRGFEVIE